MRKFFPLIAFSLILVIVAGTIGYALGVAELSKKNTTPLEPTPEAAPVAEASTKTYTNEKLGFTFEYPSDFELWEEETSTVTYVNMNGFYDLLTLEVSSQGGETFFSSLPVSKVATYNGIDWSFHEASEYCDAGECGETSVGYTTRKGNLLFTLTLGNSQSDPLTAVKILSTFKFL